MNGINVVWNMLIGDLGFMCIFVSVFWSIFLINGLVVWFINVIDFFF